MKSKLPVTSLLDSDIVPSSLSPTSTWPKPQCQHQPSEIRQCVAWTALGLAPELAGGQGQTQKGALREESNLRLGPT